jgi:selenide,water dikinase
LPAGLLAEITSKIPVISDENLLVGFDTSDDGAVYRLAPDLAIIQTLDFFPPMINDPYIFGQIAAANALSDVAAMGGEPKVALNIVAFPTREDPSVLEAILQGGAEKVAEAGAVLCGGHSISDDSIKYGLSVTGVVHPDKILHNNRCKIGDAIVLTKPVGVGILASGYNGGRVSEAGFMMAVDSMRALNQHAFDIARKYNLSAATDVTGFGFLGHLNEMVNCGYSIVVNSGNVPYFEEAMNLAADGRTTGGGRRNREFLADKVAFEGVGEPVQDLLFDPQTSGGLLISLAADDAKKLAAELCAAGAIAGVVAEVVPRMDKNILII